MQITTEDAKKITGAYLTERYDHKPTREYRVRLVRELLTKHGAERVKNLSDAEADIFISDLLLLWETR